MLSADEDALACDLAEVYHVLEWRALPVRTLAALSFGLDEDSRIKRALSGNKAKTNTILLAAIVDRLGILAWQNTESAKHGENRPESILQKIMGDDQQEDTMAFDSPEDFDKARKRILEGRV